MIFIKEVSLAYGHKKLFEEVSETISPRDRIALVGSNGSGKTTLLRMLMGDETPDSGMIEISMTGGPLVIDGKPFRSRQISQELQAIGSSFDGRLSWVGGFYYLLDQADELSGTNAIYGAPIFLPGSASVADRVLDNYTVAAFGQGTWDITDWLSATAGIRWTLDHQGYKLLNWNLASPDQTKAETQSRPTPEDQITADSDASEDFSEWTPMASVAATLPEDLRPDVLDHLMGYFTYARGFKGGGFNALGENETGALEYFEPEFLDSFEVGAKTIALDQRLTMNLSLFFGKYDNIQVTSIRDVGTVENPQVVQLTLNAARATTRGLEWEFTAIPIEGLQINGSVGVIDARYDSYIGINDLNNEEIDRAGQTFNNTPQLQTFLALQYSLPIDLRSSRALSGWLTPRLEWAYQSEVHYNGPELLAGIQRGFNLLNARLSYDFLDDRAQIALWGKNLTNEGWFGNSTPIANFFGVSLNYYEPPRTFGGELSYRF